MPDVIPQGVEVDDGRSLWGSGLGYRTEVVGPQVVQSLESCRQVVACRVPDSPYVCGEGLMFCGLHGLMHEHRVVAEELRNAERRRAEQL